MVIRILASILVICAAVPTVAYALSFPPEVQKGLLSFEAHAKCSVYAKASEKTRLERSHLLKAVAKGRELFQLIKADALKNGASDELLWLEQNDLVDVVVGQMLSDGLKAGNEALAGSSGDERRAKAAELYSAGNCELLLL